MRTVQFSSGRDEACGAWAFACSLNLVYLQFPRRTLSLVVFETRRRLSLTVLLDVLHDGPDQQGDLVAWLAALLHLLQRDTEHPGRAEGLAQGTREALPHRFHSRAASVSLRGRKHIHKNTVTYMFRMRRRGPSGLGRRMGLPLSCSDLSSGEELGYANEVTRLCKMSQQTANAVRRPL